jgi:uncharacterized UPF0160 family protein
MVEIIDIANPSLSAITHAGVFHADEVLGTAILEKAFGEVRLARVNNLPGGLSDNVIVYDIGGGRFDHHQPDGNGIRENGVPYASAGLLWKEYGPSIVSSSTDSEWLMTYVDRVLIQGVDAADNGMVGFDTDPNKQLSFSRMIAGFNPEWDEEKDFDNAFLEAVAFARTVLANVVKRGSALLRSREIVSEAIERSEGGIMVLDEALPWQDAVAESNSPKAINLLFVVFPSSRGGYSWQGIPDEPNSYTQRLSVPKAWWGLSGKDLQDAAGVADATFCHRTGFAGSAESLEGALALVRRAIAKSA